MISSWLLGILSNHSVISPPPPPPTGLVTLVVDPFSGSPGTLVNNRVPQISPNGVTWNNEDNSVALVTNGASTTSIQNGSNIQLNSGDASSDTGVVIDVGFPKLVTMQCDILMPALTPYPYNAYGLDLTVSDYNNQNAGNWFSVFGRVFMQLIGDGSMQGITLSLQDSNGYHYVHLPYSAGWQTFRIDMDINATKIDVSLNGTVIVSGVIPDLSTMETPTRGWIKPSIYLLDQSSSHAVIRNFLLNATF